MKPRQPHQPDLATAAATATAGQRRPAPLSSSPTWLWLQWLALTLTLLALVLWASHHEQVLQRSNAWLHDQAMHLHSQPASAEVVLVLADDRSIASIGRWPWRRALHAQVLQYIDQGQPQSIGLDLLLSEPDNDYPVDDLVLAQVLANSGRVVLPITQGLQAHETTQQPLPLFAQNAAALGHSHLPVDADGSVRHFHPWEADGQRHWWPHLSVAMLCLRQGQGGQGQLPQWCQSPTASAQGLENARHRLAQPHLPTATLGAGPAWQDWSHPSIRFAQPGFVHYSYVDVLQGRIPASAFRNKHVVIGASATGVALVQATPGAPQQPSMASAVLLGHILHSNLLQPAIYPAPDWVNPCLNGALLLLGMLGLWLLGPSAALLCSTALALLAVALAFAAPAWGWSLQPMAALLGLASAYPLWSWRRQSAALGFLQNEIRTLQAQGAASGLKLDPSKRSVGDFVAQHIQAVEAAMRRLQQLQTQREQAMRFISHDIRAPISAILTSIELHQHQQHQNLGDEPASTQGNSPIAPTEQSEQSEQPALLERINHHAEHALQLADDFVHLARSLEQASRQRQSLELGFLIDQLVDDHWVNAQAKGIELQWNPPLQEALCLGDAYQLRRALGNLLGNAIQYSPANRPVHIALNPAPMPIHPPTWQIAISDHGQGIEPQELSQLFTPFARQKRHEASQGGGVGLGLAYVRTVVEQHGGQVWADNRPEGGAVFTVQLPSDQEGAEGRGDSV